MIAIALTAFLLYGIGIGLYLILRKGLSPGWRRVALHLCLISSVLIPVALPYEAPKALPMGTTLFRQIPDQHLQAFCQCESPQLTHRVLFRAYAAGTWLASSTPVWLGISGLLVAIWLIRLFRSVRFIRRLVKEGHKAPLTGKIWRLIPADQSFSSAALWWGKPWLILGPETNGLAESELEAVIAHETAHLRQFHTFEQLLYQLLGILWFWNPLIWWTKRELAWLAECQADDAGLAIAGKQTYARMLMKLQENRQRLPLASGLSGMLAKRIRRILADPAQQQPAIPLLKPMAILAVQFLAMGPVQSGVAQTLSTWQAYQQVADSHRTAEEVLYCPDCETICYPEESASEH